MTTLSLKANLVDRAVRYVAPRAAAKRMQARLQMAAVEGYIGGYAGASPRRSMARWAAPNADADAASLGDLAALRNRSRDLVRNVPIASGAISTAVNGTVGTGLALQAQPDWEQLGQSPEWAAAWKRRTESEYRLWADSTYCDITRTQNMYGLQALAFRSCLESGDVLVLLPMPERIPGATYRLRVQLIEADRLANPSRSIRDGTLHNGNPVFAGVEKDSSGAPVAYHILRNHPGNATGVTEWKTDRYEAFHPVNGRRNVLHLFDRLRPDQSRGVVYLAPVIEMLHQIGKYTDSELMAAVISSFFTVFVKTPAGEAMNPLASAAASASGILPDAESSGGEDKPLELGNGIVAELAQGEEIEIADPKRPNVAFDAFMMAMFRQVGVALGLPYEVLVKHFTASYSAARAALMEAWRFYLNRRHWLALTFCQPIYEAWLDEAISIGRIQAPGYFANPAIRQAYLACEWIGDAPGSVDPLKEVQAARERIELEVSTRQQETMALTGQVWEDVHAQTVREKNMRDRDGIGSSAPRTTITPSQNPDQDHDDDDDLETKPGTARGGRR